MPRKQDESKLEKLMQLAQIMQAMQGPQLQQQEMQQRSEGQDLQLLMQMLGMEQQKELATGEREARLAEGAADRGLKQQEMTQNMDRFAQELGLRKEQFGAEMTDRKEGRNFTSQENFKERTSREGLASSQTQLAMEKLMQDRELAERQLGLSERQVQGQDQGRLADFITSMSQVPGVDPGLLLQAGAQGKTLDEILGVMDNSLVQRGINSNVAAMHAMQPGQVQSHLGTISDPRVRQGAEPYMSYKFPQTQPSAPPQAQVTPGISMDEIGPQIGVAPQPSDVVDVRTMSPEEIKLRKLRGLPFPPLQNLPAFSRDPNLDQNSFLDNVGQVGFWQSVGHMLK